MFRLIHTASNQVLLKDLPHLPYLDLSIVFFISLERNEAGQMTALIHQEHMKRWNISVNDLWEAASHNTPLEYPAEIQSMSDLLREIARKNMGEHYDPELINKLLESEDAAPLYVLSNSNGLYGASCLVYKNVLKDFADHLQADLILLPSSVHEVLLTPNLPDTSYEALSSMVTSINRQEVSPGGTAFQPGLSFFPQGRKPENCIQRTGAGGNRCPLLKDMASDLKDQNGKSPGQHKLEQNHLHRES